jgi:hypothetical protein
MCVVERFKNRKIEREVKYTVIDEGGCELVTGPVPSHNVLDKER